MSSFDELFSTWRDDPNRELTLQLCSELPSSGRGETAREIGATASTWHARDLEVMLAVGRMFLKSGLLNEAQSTLAAAGKLDARDGRPFRYLAEVLLRRGDALRAEKVLERAQALAATDPETRRLVQQVKALIPLQKQSGMQAVASQVTRSLATRANGTAMSASQGARPLPRFDVDDAQEISEVYEREATTLARRVPSVVPAPRKPATPRKPGPASFAPPKPPATSRHPKPLSSKPLPSRAQPVASLPSRVVAPKAVAPQRAQVPSVDLSEVMAESFPSLDELGAAVAERDPLPAPLAQPHKLSVPPPLPSPTPAPMVLPREQPSFEDQAALSPALIFEHLARVGVFEPSGGAHPVWEAAPKRRARGIIPLIVGCVLLSGAGIGGYEYSRRLEAERAQHAAALTSEVAKLLHSGKVADLKSTDQKLSQAFDLDSRSRAAARLWVENRVLGALLLAEEPTGIDSAVHRGRTAGLTEPELAAGRIASFLVEGDLAGAAAQLPKWDKLAAKDALYQVAAGAVLERAGDPRAIERYSAAQKLDPELLVADILLARWLLLESGPERARPVIEELVKKGAEPLTVQALNALAWVVDPERPAAPPAEARLGAEGSKRLPAPLAAVPPLVEATQAMLEGQQERAGAALDRAIALSHGPALPTTLGFLAIEAGNEVLARKAALRALSFAALYPRARTLAARVALLGGRLDEAQKAVEGLDPKSAEVVVVRAVVAYETGEVLELDESLAAVGGGRDNEAFAALASAPGVLAGSKFPDTKSLSGLATPAVPWGRPIALDAALDLGNLKLAEELAGRIQGEASPAEQLRLARLARYRGKLEQALTASERAFAGKPTAALVVERVYELIQGERLDDAKELIAKYPALLGTLGGWLSVLVDVAGKQAAKATLRLTKLDPPPDAAPSFQRVLAARALSAARDKRARSYLAGLPRRLARHPDLP